MITYPPTPVRVGHWHVEHRLYNSTLKAYEGQNLKEVRFDGPNDFTGTLLGFAQEDEGDGVIVVAVVEHPNGTFHTPSVTVIQKLTP